MLVKNDVAVRVRSFVTWSAVVAVALIACAPDLRAQSPRAIEVLHERLLPLFELSGVVYTDADEATGKLVVGVMDRDVEALVRERLPELGVMSRLVEVVETEPILQVASLRDKIRDVPGGVQIRWSNYVCTLGFPATRGTISGFVTNNHCSSKQGSVDGTNYYQPLNQVADEYIGKETADPAYFKGGGCPRGKQCRYSDSNFSAGASTVGFAVGKIAKTDGVNTGSLTIAGQFTIAGKGSVSTGTVNKVGRTTGWTQGTITNKCANVAVSGTNIVNLCQDIVQNPEKTIVQGGDSGSPVFSVGSGDEVTLLGILWGGNSSGTLFVYSPIANVERELGALLVQ